MLSSDTCVLKGQGSWNMHANSWKLPIPSLQVVLGTNPLYWLYMHVVPVGYSIPNDANAVGPAEHLFLSGFYYTIVKDITCKQTLYVNTWWFPKDLRLSWMLKPLYRLQSAGPRCFLGHNIHHLKCSSQIWIQLELPCFFHVYYFIADHYKLIRHWHRAYMPISISHIDWKISYQLMIRPPF